MRASIWRRVGVLSFCFLSVAAVSLARADRARAADLRVDFGELAAVMQKILVEAKVKLDNSPGFLGLSLAGGSQFVIGGATIPIDLPPNEASFANTRVRYYVSDLSSTRISASARPGALRLAVEFEDAGPELVGDCIQGFCADQSLPNIEWRRPSVSVDLVPVEVKGSIALEAKQVLIGGNLVAVCRSNVGLISAGVCSALKPIANNAIARVVRELPNRLRAKLNEPESKEKMAAGLKRLLTLGPAGEVRVARIAVDSKGILVSFRF